MAAASEDTPASFGKYRVESVLGRGAMGVVYRGIEDGTALALAIKTINKDLLAGAERQGALDRFRREADIARMLEHPGIVRVHDYGDLGDTAFMAMELVDGKELKELADGAEPVAIERVVELMSKVLDALDYAHKRGVVHRDIKPANVLVRPDDTTKLMDFGIARLENSEMTQAGSLMGTPSYISPEQFLGDAVDHRADIFSAGVMLYQLLTGRKPFTGSLAVQMHAILSVDPLMPSQLSSRVHPAFDAVVAKAMAKNRERRFQSAADFAAALRAALATAAAQPMDDGEGTVLDSTEAESGPDTREAPGGRSVYATLDHLGGRLAAAVESGLAESVDTELLAAMRTDAQMYHSLAGRDGAAADQRLGVVIGRDVDRLAAALPRLRDLIVEGAPLPGKEITGERFDWMESIDLLKTVAGLLAALGAGARAQPALDAVKRELSTAAMLYANEINRVLFSPDPVEIMRISADFMRLDILQWALEELGGQAEVRTLRGNTRMFASQVMRKVNATIREFTERHDEFARFDVASLLAEVEELTVIATRIIENDPDGDAGADYFKALGRDVIVDFIGNARAMAALMAPELEAEIAADQPDVDAFRGKLGQLGGLYRFSICLDDESCREPLKLLTAEASAAIHRLGDLVRTALAGAPPGSPRDEAVTGLLTALHEVGEDLGWRDFCATLLADLRTRLVAASRP